MTNFKSWHVVRDVESGRRFCIYDNPDMPTLDFGEPDPMEGKEEIPYKEWTSKEIGDIIAAVFDYRGVNALVRLPEITLQAMEDCKLDEKTQAEVMRGIFDILASDQSD